MRRSILLAAALTLTPLAGAGLAKVAAPYAAALADPGRPAEDKAADAIRKPVETLAFAGVKPGMVVGEFYPGGGYFTRLLSTAVGAKGHVYAIENQRWVKKDAAPAEPFAGGRYGNVTYTVAPFGTAEFPVKLDLAWVTQNYHDLKIAKYGNADTAAFNKAVFAALKRGGVFMVIDHEAPKGTTTAQIEKLHRIERAQVIAEVTAAGFRLAGEGKFLRNPGDDHTLSVFDPKVRGHTDQYALRFVKP